MNYRMNGRLEFYGSLSKQLAATVYHAWNSLKFISETDGM